MSNRPFKCKCCDYFKMATDEAGTCHRHAPKPSIHQGISCDAPMPFHWPVVLADTVGCGEGKADGRF